MIISCLKMVRSCSGKHEIGIPYSPQLFPGGTSNGRKSPRPQHQHWYKHYVGIYVCGYNKWYCEAAEDCRNYNLCQKKMNRSIFRAWRSVQPGSSHPVAPGRRYASSASFSWEDPLAASELYTEEELAIQDTARQYCQERLLPRVLGMRPYISKLTELC